MNHLTINQGICLCALKYLKSRLRDLLHSSSFLLGTQGLKFCAVWTHMFSTNRYWITKPKLFCMAVESELQGSKYHSDWDAYSAGKKVFHNPHQIPYIYTYLSLFNYANDPTNSNITRELTQNTDLKWSFHKPKIKIYLQSWNHFCFL